MTTSRSRFGLTAGLLSLTLVVVAFGSAVAQRRPAAIEPAAVTVSLPAQTAADGYVGEARCQSCHRAELTQFHKTVHARVASADGAQPMNCESCHGSGKAHADAIEAARGDLMPGLPPRAA